MEKHKYTSSDVEKAGRYSKKFLCIFLGIVFLIIIFDAFSDKNLMLKSKIIGIFINSSVLVVCYFVGEAYRKYYIKKKLKILRK